MRVRPGRDSDAAGFIALIRACWAEYPGCVLDVDGEVPELRALATWFAERGGALWAAEQEGAVAGMVGVRPLPAEPGAWEVGRMYVAAAQRGTGLAQRLLAGAEAHARAAGADRLVLWTDTRFDRAHRFYEAQSYIRQGPVRALDDLSKSLEFRYAKPVRGVAVEVLDAAGAASAGHRLAGVLVDCVAAGDRLSFRSPLAPATARAFWHGVAKDVAAGRRRLVAGWREGVLVGAVQLDCATPSDQAHRAKVTALMVAPAARRQGVGRALMQRAEAVACAAGRRLLTLGTPAGGAAEGLCRALGWQEAGRIPGYALDAEGVPQDHLVWWKTLPA